MEQTNDSIVQAVIERFKTRAEVGLRKYGTDLDREDLKVGEWIQHLQDELHDAYLYSEKLKQEYQNEKRLLELALQFIEGYLTEEEEVEYNALRRWYNRKNK